MTLNTKRIVIVVLSLAFLGSLVLVQWLEVVRRAREAGLRPPEIRVPDASKECVDCHQKSSPGIAEQWLTSTHAQKGVGCVDCHQAEADDADVFSHYGAQIATIVTPKDCGRCHGDVAKEFAESHHAKGGNILASLDNFLAETVEGSRVPFSPHGPEGEGKKINGMASANTGCRQCHGSKVALLTKDGKAINVDDLKPGPDGKPTAKDMLANLARDDEGRPKLDPQTWPNTGIGRINLDGSLGSCTACHSRHDFSPRRARQPENCGKCHLGPDHPQKEIYEESKHGVAFRDLKDKMNLDGVSWILGKDYSQAPTCASCHMSGHTRNGGKVTHDPGKRLSWTNRPPISKHLDDWETKRRAMMDVCTHCHTQPYVNAFYTQYDEFVELYNAKFGRPGQAIMKALLDQKLRTKAQFDEEIEWTWFYLWHHEGRRARHGASMMAPDYAHWHGMYEVAERFYVELIPQAREITEHAASEGKTAEAEAVNAVVDEILARPEHAWFEKERAKREHPAEDSTDG